MTPLASPPTAPRSAPKTDGSERPAQTGLESARPSVPPYQLHPTVLWRAGGILKTMRPHQWVKNLFVLAPVVFAKDIFKPALLFEAFCAFGVFCLLASAVYTMNDLVDVDADRAHPIKRDRPIASGRVPVPVARAVLVILLAVALGAAVREPWPFVASVLAYFTLNVAYSFRLKKVAYVDVSCIAAGFVLRVVAGGYATNIRVSWYLLACTALLALFLGFGKRRHELAQAAHSAAKKQRHSLQAYAPRALTVALGLTGTATVVTYVAYTLDPATRVFFKSDWLWLTAPFTVFGVLRFLQLVAGRPKAESPTQEMLRDTPFVFNLVLWVIVILAVVYRIRPSEMP